MDIVVLDSIESFEELEKALQTKTLILDTETTGLYPYQGSIPFLMMAFCMESLAL